MSGIRNRGALPMRNKHKVNDLIFYTLMVAFPLAQFCVFYISVNINSILLAFRSYSSEDGGFVWAQFDNFANIFRDFAASATLKTAMLNSLLVWAASTAVSLPLAMLFSYYIYNKRPASGVFKTLLFLPSVIPGIAITVIYLYFVERAIPAFAADVCGITVEGLLQNPATRFGAIFFYNVFLSFGGNVILLLGGMNTVDPSVREAAYLDGAKGWCEFRHIILPKVWPTLTTFFVMGVASIFTNQFNLYNFYGIAASEKLATMGYLLYARTSIATMADYPELAATGLLLTAVIIPLTLLAKKMLEKFGPSED